MATAGQYPPPFDPADYVVGPTDGPDERIEVGVAVVGAGPAGLACAIRFGQLLEKDPETAEALGEVPLAVVDKGRQPGSHLLSGVIVNPRSLRTLLGAKVDDMPNYGPVTGEGVYVLQPGRSLRIPTPPPFRNHGNVISSLSRLGRWLAEQAEELGTVILPETSATQLLVEGEKVLGVRTGDKGRGLDGTEQRNFEPGSDITAKVTVLAEGTQGHLTGVALDRFGLAGDEPQIWELGVKEVWKVARPLDKIMHTMGWPLRLGAKYREFGGSFIYPMGPDMVSIGIVVGLDYRDVELSVHDLLQELKTHPLVAAIIEGGERLEWGAKTIPSGGFHSLPSALHADGLLLCGDAAGMVSIPTLKGVHYAVESGRLAAEAAYAAVKAQLAGNSGADQLAGYDQAVKSSFIYDDLYKVRDMRGVFARGFLVGGALSSLMTVTRGKVTLGKVRAERDDTAPLIHSGRAARYPAPDGTTTFDKLSSVFASGNRSRDDQPNHIKITQRVAADVAVMWTHLCPAKVYELGERHDDGTIDVVLSPSNCVQCGAISAKGGRLTPPEGGSGPEYTLT